MKYQNATKDNWRGWAWNQMERRLPPGSTVMVMTGSTQEDARHARRRGFRCIGVDIDEDNIRAWRESGEVGIKDRIEKQVVLMKPDGVIIDMLGGITMTSNSVLFLSMLHSSAVVWNGMRGRDRLGAMFCDEVSQAKVPAWDFKRRHIRAVTIGRHRGKAYIAMIAAMTYASKIGLDIRGSDKETKFCVPDEWYISLGNIYKPSYNEYVSSDTVGLTYDSFAITCDKNGAQLFQKELPAKKLFKSVATSSRKAAAAKAILTMRSGRC